MGGEAKETYGFKSLKPAPSSEGLKEFESKLIELVRSVETKRVKNGFQDKLRKDAEMIRSDDKMYVSADKTKTSTNLTRTRTTTS